VIIAVGFTAVWRAGGLAADALELTRSKTQAMWARQKQDGRIPRDGSLAGAGGVKGAALVGIGNVRRARYDHQNQSPNFRKIIIEVTRRDGDAYILAKLTGM